MLYRAKKVAYTLGMIFAEAADDVFKGFFIATGAMLALWMFAPSAHATELVAVTDASSGPGAGLFVLVLFALATAGVIYLKIKRPDAYEKLSDQAGYVVGKVWNFVRRIRIGLDK